MFYTFLNLPSTTSRTKNYCFLERQEPMLIDLGKKTKQWNSIILPKIWFSYKRVSQSFMVNPFLAVTSLWMHDYVCSWSDYYYENDVNFRNYENIVTSIDRVCLLIIYIMFYPRLFYYSYVSQRVTWEYLMWLSPFRNHFLTRKG